MLLEIENLFFYAGVLAFSAGVLQIVFALFKRGYGFFKSGVVAMFLGDASFAVAIAFPKKAKAIFEQMGIDNFPLPSTAAGIVLGIFLVLIGGLLFIRSQKKISRKNKAESLDTGSTANQGSSTLDNAEKKADPALFSQVIKTQGSVEVDNSSRT